MRFIPEEERLKDPYLREIVLKRIPRSTMASSDHNFGQFETPKNKAILLPEIALNSASLIWSITFDVDKPGGILAWGDADLPPPNVATVNRSNGHAHLTWILERPVSFGPSSRPKPQALLRRIKALFSSGLEADPSYNGSLTYNPLNRAREVYASDRPAYSLEELLNYSEHLSDRIKPKKTTRREGSAKDFIEEGARNNGIFNAIRLWAYSSVSSFDSFENFNQSALSQVETLNRDLDSPLPTSEERSIARSISAWVWKKKGAFIARKDLDTPKQRRGIPGAIAAAAVKAKKTGAAIAAAVIQAGEEAGRLIMGRIAEIAGISERTLRRYRGLIAAVAAVELGIIMPGLEAPERPAIEEAPGPATLAEPSNLEALQAPKGARESTSRAAISRSPYQAISPGRPIAGLKLRALIFLTSFLQRSGFGIIPTRLYAIANPGWVEHDKKHEITSNSGASKPDKPGALRRYLDFQIPIRRYFEPPRRKNRPEVSPGLP